MDHRNSIKSYFKDKNIFITGGTGFIGKALIEKLLRSCPDLNKIYILVRSKRGKVLQERVEQLISSDVFGKLKKTLPENLKKIVPISGDTTALGLGLSQEDRQLLKNEVQVFFHAAASVRFDDPLKDAIFVNLRGAREAALLALEMKQLDVFTFVSTTYCNINNKKVVYEILYPPTANWEETIKVAEECNTDILNVLTQKYMGEFPNTYTFTKHLAEHCINDLLIGRVRTVIYRPSVVIASFIEPIPGWVDNLNGPVGLLLGFSTGILRTFFGSPDVDTDYICVDIVVKSMIVAAWNKAVVGMTDTVDIYNGSKNNFYYLKLGKLGKLAEKVSWEVPVDKKIWIPTGHITDSWLTFYIRVALFHLLPAFLIDTILRIFGYSPILMKIQRKVFVANLALIPFTTMEWSFINDNVVKLEEKIPKAEYPDFFYKIRVNTEHQQFLIFCSIMDYARGYFLKETRDEDEKKSVKTLCMYYLDRACKLIFYGFMIWLICFKINIFALLWQAVCNYWDSLN